MASKTEKRASHRRLKKVLLYAVFSLGVLFWVLFGIINGVDWQHHTTAGTWGEPVGWLTYLIEFAVWTLALGIAALIGRQVQPLYSGAFSEASLLLYFGCLQMIPVLPPGYSQPVFGIACLLVLFIVIWSGRLEQLSLSLADSQDDIANTENGKTNGH